MSAAAAASQATTQPGRLLSLIPKLIDYGKALAATARQRVAADPSFARTGFGTADLAVIFAHIARGLHLAQALETRVQAQAARLPRLPIRVSATGPPPSRSPPRHAAGLDPVVRRRPIAAVIADICRDLGIMPSHPLWPELRDLIIRYGGNLARLLKDIFDRTLGPVPSARSLGQLPHRPLQSPAPYGTGPP